MDTDEFDRLRRDANAVGLVSLDTNYSRKKDDMKKNLREVDVIENEYAGNPVIESQKKSLKKLIARRLTRAERLIVFLYYYDDMTMKEIGATLDLSESRVSQMHSSIIDRLKAQMHEREEEYIMAC